MMTLIAYGLGRLHEKRLRGGNGLCYEPPQSHSVEARLDTVRSTLRGLRLFTSFPKHYTSEALTPQPSYTHLTSTCYVGELNGGQ